MLQTLIFTETELNSDDVKRLEQYVNKAGGILLAVCSVNASSLTELFRLHPDIVIIGSSGPVSLSWAFLLRLRHFRLQGKAWPKVFLASLPTHGRYLAATDRYDEDELDYFDQVLPYQELYDLALSHLLEELTVCFPVFELERLTFLITTTKKQWVLTDGLSDYGLLTFKSLEPIRLDIPGVICTFQAYPAFNEVRPLFDRALSFMRQEVDGPTEWTRRRVAIINSRFHMKSVGEPMQIDKFLITPRTFSIFIEEEEARFWLQAA